MNVALFVPAQTALGENVRTWARPGAKRRRHHFLGMAHSVNSSRVDPVNAKLEPAMNRGDGRLVVLLAPTKLPTRSTDCPGAKADRSDRQVRVTELLRFHIKPSFHRNPMLAFNLPPAGAIRRTAMSALTDSRLHPAVWRFDTSPPHRE